MDHQQRPGMPKSGAPAVGTLQDLLEGLRFDMDTGGGGGGSQEADDYENYAGANDGMLLHQKSAARTMTAITLRTVIFLGSARNVVPPWGGDARLGDRVSNWVKSILADRKSPLGTDLITHQVHVIDPIEVFGPNGALSHSGGEMRAPTFFSKPSQLSPETLRLQELIKEADCYLIVSPEYNHSVPPALASLMGHFGGSNYKCKPSGIVTYSPGPFAGMRAAMAIQILCHELGCLPVSKLCGIPVVSELLELDGSPKEGSDQRMLKQLPELLTQLEWMAMAMKNQREKTGTF